MMDAVIGPGRPEDAGEAARLIADTDAGLFRLYGGGDLGLWLEIAEAEWRHERGIYSFTAGHVARRTGEVVGVLVGYPARAEGFDWSLGCSRRHVLPAERWATLDAVRPLAALLFPAVPPGAYYVQNVATRPDARGRGLGRRLMDLALAAGRAAGCRECLLDVDASTPAVGFYERLGFRVVVRTEVPALAGLHAHLRMALEL